MPQYKIWKVWIKGADLLESEDYSSYSKACEAAKLIAYARDVTVYVLESTWLCYPQRKVVEEKIIEQEPQAAPRED